MLERISAHPANANRQREYVLIGLLTCVYVFSVLKYSYLYGNLSSLPGYDDCVYLRDGAERLDIFYGSGFRALLSNLKHQPPHSPFSTLLALVAFAVCGMQFWAPYAFNSIIVATVLCFTNRLLDGAALWQKGAAFIFVLCMPFMVKAVSEFRPDMACGLVTAGGAIYTLSAPCVSCGWRRSVLCGLIFAGAMLVKPSAWVMSLGIFAGSLFLSAACDWILSKEKASLWQRLHGIPIAVAVFTAACLPYYRTEWRTLVHYLHIQLFEVNDIWELKAPLSVRMRYYLTGPGGDFMLGQYVYLFAAIILAGYTTLLIKKMKPELVRFSSYLIVIVVAYFVPSVKTFSTPFFAATFDAMLLFTSLCFFRLFLLNDAFKGRARLTVTAGLAAVVFSSVLFFKLPNYMGARKSPEFIGRERSAKAIYEEVKDRCEAGGAAPRVYFTFSGSINETNLALLFLRAGLKPPPIEGCDLSTDMYAKKAAFARSDIVVASEPGNVEVYGWVPVGTIQGELLSVLRHDPNFVEVRTVSVYNSNPFVIFARRGIFDGVVPVQGMAAIEGPYPAWNLPVVRWGLYPESILKISTGESGSKHLQMTCKTEMATETMTVLLNGKEVFRHTFAEPGKFVDLDVPLDLATGANTVRLNYSTGAQVVGKPMAVLFSRLRLSSNSDAK